MTTDPLVGALIGRYRIDRVLGRGGMGRVYLGVHPEIGSRVAIKVLADEWADSKDLLDRFFAEAHTVNLIRHDNIITVLDLDRMPNGRPFIVMEYIAGRSLREVVEAGPAPLGGVVHVMIEVLIALAAAHAAGVVHRDLKPDNVMVTAAGRTKVLDFGIAKLVAAGPRTRTGSALGTPEYMAPEQILGEPVDARADLYAAGVMLFELCTGRRPFAGATDYQLMEGHLRGAVPSARAVRSDVPEALDAVIAQALAKHSGERFQSATAMAHALRVASADLAPTDWQPLVTGEAAAVSFDALPIATEREAPITSDERASPLPPAPRGEGRLDERTRTAPKRDSAPDAAAREDRTSTPTVPSTPKRAAAPSNASRSRRRATVIVLGAAVVLGAGALVTTKLVQHEAGVRDASIATDPRDAADDATSVATADDAAALRGSDSVGTSPDLVDAGTVAITRDGGSRDAGVVGRRGDAGTAKLGLDETLGRDAGIKPDASETITAAHGPRTHAGWNPDKVWGFDPPIKTDPVTHRHSQSFDHDLGTDTATFDAGGYAATALRIARELEPDAVLTGFDTFLDANGQLSKSTRNDTQFARMWFRSPAAAAAMDANRLACIYAFPGVGGLRVERFDDCDPKPAAPVPRCRVADVLAKVAHKDGTKRIDVAYGPKGWRITQWRAGDDESDAQTRSRLAETVPDDCSR